MLVKRSKLIGCVFKIPAHVTNLPYVYKKNILFTPESCLEPCFSSLDYWWRQKRHTMGISRTITSRSAKVTVYSKSIQDPYTLCNFVIQKK